MSTYRGVNTHLAWCLNSVLNVKALVGTFNQEKDLVGAFSVIKNLRVDPDSGAPTTYPGHCYALHCGCPGLATGITVCHTGHCMWSLCGSGLGCSRCRTGMLPPASTGTQPARETEPGQAAGGGAGWWPHTVALCPAPHHRL